MKLERKMEREEKKTDRGERRERGEREGEGGGRDTCGSVSFSWSVVGSQ